MSTIKSFETFINEGLTTQYLPINEGMESEGYTYETLGEKIKQLGYLNVPFQNIKAGKYTAKNIPGYISKYANLVGVTQDKVYAALLANPDLAEIDSMITAKAEKSGTSDELNAWKANPAKNFMYAFILLDIDMNREEWKRWLNRNKSSVVVATVDTKSKIKTQPGKTDPTQTVTQPNSTAVPFQFMQDGSKGDVFVINEWILSDTFKAAIDSRVADIKQTIAGLTPPEGKPKAFCPSITIKSSCSTAPNKTPINSPGADKYSGRTISFMELSTERANAVSTYLKAKLAEAGVLIDADTKVTIETAGQNGDGTSGPAWNEVQGATNADKLAQIKKFQMADISFEILFNDTTVNVTPSVETKIEGTAIPGNIVEVPAGEYKLTLSTQIFRLHWPEITLPRLPRIKIKLPRLGGTPRYMRCYKF
jgi:hypothetical protein